MFRINIKTMRATAFLNLRTSNSGRYNRFGYMSEILGEDTVLHLENESVKDRLTSRAEKAFRQHIK